MVADLRGGFGVGVDGGIGTILSQCQFQKAIFLVFSEQTLILLL